MHPAEQIALILGRIYRNGMTTTSGGNLSIREENGNIWITPASVDKGSLTAADIVCVTPEGACIGQHKPSSEFPFHKAIYDIRPEMRAVIHAHPPALVAFSITHRIPDTNMIPQAKRICGRVGFAPYGLPGSEELGKKIAAEFRDNPDIKAVIMENHGTVLCGTDLTDACTRFETLEFCARTLIHASILGGVRRLTEEEIRMRENPQPTDFVHFTNADYPSDEQAIRSEIVRMVHRACDQGLMSNAYGNVSVRWKGNDFLITPSGVPRREMGIEDVVQIRDGRVESGKTPSRYLPLHHAIYCANPHINSIILTRPPHLMGFATSEVELNVRTIPESWILLKDIPTIQYKEDNLPIARLFDERPCILLAGDSVVVTGDGLLQTFDRLEVAEFTARSLIMATSLGKLYPISNGEIEELRVAFQVK